MCKVKSGKAIVSKSDFQNLVIGILLRQQNNYRETDIFNAVSFHCTGSPLALRPLTVQRAIRDNLHFLTRYGKVTCMDGVYTPVPCVKSY